MQIERADGVVRLMVRTDPIWDDFAFSRLVTAAIRDEDREIVIDLAWIPALHSPGLANLVSIYVHASKRGKRLVLINLNATNRRVLKATQLDQLFVVE